MNKAQQILFQQHQQQQHQQQQRHQQQQQQQLQQQQQQHQQQISHARVGVSVNQKKHIQQQQQQQRGRTSHQILAEAMQFQQETSGLNIINGSHLKKSETRKTSTAFTQLIKPKKPIQTSVRPKRSQPKKEEPFQSIKVSAKGGVITLYSEKDEDKVEVSEEMKNHITSSMYGYEDTRWRNTSTTQHQFEECYDQHDECFVQGAEESSTTHLRGERRVDTEVVYYTVCTHFFHPEKHDWIQKIHRMGQVRVPKNRSHQQTCVFLNHLYDPDKEEIIVHKLLQENEIVNSQDEMMLMNENHSNTFQRKKFDQSIHVVASSSNNHNSNTHNKSNHNNSNKNLNKHRSSNNSNNGLKSFKQLQNTSWESQAFSEAYDTMSERNAHSFDEFDTAFDARSVDSSISSRSGFHHARRPHSTQQRRDTTNDYSKYIQQQMNASSDCDC